jgi:hypothetical protein
MAAKHLSTNGVPRNKQALRALVETGSAEGVLVDQKRIDLIGFVTLEVHPQQINVRDKANHMIIATINR